MYKAKLSRIYLLVLLTGLCVFKVAAGEKDDWKLGEDKDGIKIYTRKSEQGKIRTSKAIMFLNVPTSKVVETLTDLDGYNKWFPNCLDAKVLKQVSDHETISHMIYKTPWPLPNVDCIQRMVIDKKKGDTVCINVNAEPDYIGPCGNCSRVKQMKGSWQIIAVNGGSLLINIYYSDMAGIIPYWLANTQAVDIPFGFFHNMREYILTGKAKK
jgi:hypothetical protein